MQHRITMYIDSQNSQSEVTVQVHSDMLTREEKYILVSMNLPPVPDLSGMWNQYAEAIA